MFIHPSTLYSATNIFLPKSCVTLQVGLHHMVIANGHQVLSSLARPCLFPLQNHQALHQLVVDNNEIINGAIPWQHFSVTSMRHCSKCTVEWNLNMYAFAIAHLNTLCLYSLLPKYAHCIALGIRLKMSCIT